MKRLFCQRAAKAFTLLELLIVIAIVAILLAMALPTRHYSGAGPSVRCMSNLKQIGLGFLMWAADHNDRFPTQVSATNGGSMGFIATGSPAPHFQTITNYVPLKVWVCPTDTSRQPAALGKGLDERSVSYFASLDASSAATNASFVILAGDRHLQVAGQPVHPGLFVLSTNRAVDWTAELHGQGKRAMFGNLLFVDGHVERVRTGRVAAVILRQELATNRIAVP